MSEPTVSETRLFQPTADFASQSHLGSLEAYRALHKRSIDDPEGFWSEVASELTWMKPWDKVLDDSEAPFYKWFTGGKTNITVNCIDRHVEAGNGDRVAIYWEGEPGDSRVLTYADMQKEISRFANTLKAMGIGKGDSVAIYLPMVPELAIATLACARIGAVHSVIFAGFSAESIKDRVLDASSKAVITSDGTYRRGKELLTKNIVDEGVADCDCIKNVLVVQRHPEKEPFAHGWVDGRDHWYHDLAKDASDECAPEEMDAEDMLFLLYTSGSTGKPKGIMHTTGGYMVGTYLTSKLTFDLKPEKDVYWCTADVGWITGHSYIVYGPMQNGVSQVMYEGAPNYPAENRFWEIVEKYKVSIFYTAPTAIRAFMKWGDAHVTKHDLSSLRLLGTVGEPINPEAWMWYHRLIGAEKCPIVDTWWQTETGGHMLTPLPGAIATKPGSATVPFPGIDAAVLDEEGNEVERGILAIRKPWPSMLRGIYGDPERYKSTYWCKWDGKYYFPGDGAIKDEDGYFWITGRVDDVVNVSGHRIGTAELESVFVEHPAVAESAVIGVPHEIKGQGLVAFVIIRTGAEGDEAVMRKELTSMVDSKIGKFARPEKIIFSGDLPKTRSGKIMRRLLRDIAEDRPLGNISTLADPSVVETLKEKIKG